mgnify:CR=1 FL=1
MPAPIDIPLSNHAIEGSSALAKTPSLVIRSDGLPHNTHVELTDGTKLGLIQGILWNLRVDGYATCVIETIATPGEFRALAKNTVITTRPSLGYHPLRYLWDWYATKVSSWVTALWAVAR